MARFWAVLALAALLAVLATPGRLAAQPAGEAPLALPDELRGATLRVGVKEAPPFAIRDAGGEWSGISIDLWRQLAADLGVTFELEERTIEGMLDGAAAGELDLAIAALTVTAEREAQLDFSHPYYTSGLGIAVVPDRRSTWQTAAAALLSPAFLKAVGALLAVLLVTGGLMWLIERRRNEEQFGGPAGEGLGNGFWWSAVTMTTVGYGDKAPVTFLGRLLALIWMFTSVIVISGFTAAIASGLTVARLDTPVEGPGDLPRVKVGAVAASTSASYLGERRVAFLVSDDAEAALAELAAGRVDAVVHDAPILRYLAGRGETPFQVLPATFKLQSYAIALPPGSPLREPLNRALLERTGGRDWGRILERYLGAE